MAAHSSDENFMASGDYLSAVRDFALLKGISPAKLVEGSELSYDDMINPPEFMPNLIVNKIGLNLYKNLSNPVADAADFGLCMTASSHGSLGLAVQSAPTMRDAYGILKEFYHTRINSQNIHIAESGEEVIVTLSNQYKDENLDEGIKRFFDLATLITIGTNTYRAIDKTGLKGHITLHIDTPEPLDFPYQRLEGLQVVFDSVERKLTLPAAWQDRPLSIANPSMARAALERCEQELRRLSPKDLVAKIQLRLQQSQEKLPSLREVAAYLNMSTATLKRKLKDQSTTYQNIKNEARLAKAVELINSGRESIENIADKLGFSDASNFTKAFKKWTGDTPKEYRDKNTKSDSKSLK